MLNKDEVKGDDNQQDYGMRIYDTRLGRFLSVDPIAKEYPWYTPYQFAGNMPIWAIDLDGLEPAFKGGKDGQYEIAPVNGTEKQYGWSWSTSNSNWEQRGATEYTLGDAIQNSGDDDLSKTYYADQNVFSLFCGHSEGCHLNTFAQAFGMGISLEGSRAEREGAILFQRFVNGSNGTRDIYSFETHTEMARLLSQDNGFIGVKNNFENEALEFYRENGSLEGFNGAENLTRPYVDGTFFMHTVMGGTQQVDAIIKAISDKDIKVEYRVWDHFGAGRNDASSKLPGLPSMYWLQHNSWQYNQNLGDKYSPFIWNIILK